MYPVGRYIIILTREGWGTSTDPPYFEHCTGAPSLNGASTSAPFPCRGRSSSPPPPADRPLPENRQVYFEPGCIQDPFSYPLVFVRTYSYPSRLHVATRFSRWLNPLVFLPRSPLGRPHVLLLLLAHAQRILLLRAHLRLRSRRN